MSLAVCCRAPAHGYFRVAGCRPAAAEVGVAVVRTASPSAMGNCRRRCIQWTGVELGVLRAGHSALGCGDPPYPEAMKVLEGLKAIQPGSVVPVTKLGLPVTGRKGLLLVFWKST